MSAQIATKRNEKNSLRVPSTHEMEVGCKDAVHNMKVSKPFKAATHI